MNLVGRLHRYLSKELQIRLISGVFTYCQKCSDTYLFAAITWHHSSSRSEIIADPFAVNRDRDEHRSPLLQFLTQNTNQRPNKARCKNIDIYIYIYIYIYTIGTGISLSFYIYANCRLMFGIIVTYESTSWSRRPCTRRGGDIGRYDVGKSHRGRGDCQEIPQNELAVTFFSISTLQRCRMCSASRQQQKNLL